MAFTQPRPDRQGEVMLEHSPEGSPRESKPANVLILGCQRLERRANDCLLLWHPVCGLPSWQSGKVLIHMPQSQHGVGSQGTPIILQLPPSLKSQGGSSKYPSLTSRLQQAHHFRHKGLAIHELPMVSQPLIFIYRPRDKRRSCSTQASDKYR